MPKTITVDGIPVTEADANPQPPIWPQCPTCETPWVLRRAYVLGKPATEFKWIWQRDCKHKAMGVIATKDGPV
jgi:hypothetical protein